MTSTSSTSVSPALHVANLLPVAGPTDRHNELVFALCDSTLSTVAANPSDFWCRHLRRVLDADTVYLLDRTTSSTAVTHSSAVEADGSVHDDTLAIHSALCNLLEDAHNCAAPVWLPPLRVFAGQPTMAMLLLPLDNTRHGKIAVIVEPELSAELTDRYLTAALLASYHSVQTLELCAPASDAGESMQRTVFDYLQRHHWPISASIQQRRFQLFERELRSITVQFEKLTELDGSGDSCMWGWQAVPALIQNDQLPERELETAKLWGKQFVLALDSRLLAQSAQHYATLIEAANHTRFNQIKPFCVRVAVSSLQQQDYRQALSEMLEKAVISGTNLVLELAENESPAAAPVNAITDRMIAETLATLRKNYAIRFALDKFGVGSQSFRRFLDLEPEVIKMDRSILGGNAKTMALELLRNFSELTSAANSLDSVPLDTQPALEDFAPYSSNTGPANASRSSEGETA